MKTTECIEEDWGLRHGSGSGIEHDWGLNPANENSWIEGYLD